MLRKWAQLLGLARDIESGSKRKKETRGLPLPDKESGGKKGGDPMPVSLSLKSKDMFVRIIHPGGREELYSSAVPAFHLLEKYPGKCVARPEVFKNPHESLVWPEEKLLPGQKYYIVPSSTVQKLKRKHPEKVKGRASDEDKEDMWDDKIMDQGEINFEESVFSAKEFYASNGRWSRNLLKRGIRKKKPFVPPLPKARSYKGPGWEPSLTSVQELSP
ncbi:hypothetical protein PanWU01x14_125500 [Parasponia andersonii]|uniref:Uncharacterized protein n=1 Tax=Parasponia andersonii TaxID=3476 RepID=A0A2P5CTE9_PARAD|nr:hypothetical protein PanWU01x14_125500 [Parasponia andersonii]